MERDIFINKLYDAFSENGMSELLDDASAVNLSRFAEMLINANKRTNLTAITDENGIILKHFIDSISISKHIPQGSTMIDIGCGAGFPSIPIAIVRSDVLITSIDSTGKKIEFINQVSDEFKISNIRTECTRAEDYIKGKREQFDVATSRAVARLNVLSELCVPFVKIGGSFIAMKSSKGDVEHAEAARGLKVLNTSFKTKEIKRLTYCSETIEREIYIFEKTGRTPDEFPRNYSQIIKRPL